MRTIKGRVVQQSNKISYPVVNAQVTLSPGTGSGHLTQSDTSSNTGGGLPYKPQFVLSDSNGYYTIDVPDDQDVSVNCTAFGVPANSQSALKDYRGDIPDLNLYLDLMVKLTDQDTSGSTSVTADQQLTVQLSSSNQVVSEKTDSVQWETNPNVYVTKLDTLSALLTVPQGVRQFDVEAWITEKSGTGSMPPPAYTNVTASYPVIPTKMQTVRVQEPVSVRLQRTTLQPTLDQALWVAIENRTDALKYRRYEEFMYRNLNRADPGTANSEGSPSLGMHFGRPYVELMALTRAYLLMECGTVRIDPGIDRNRLDSGDDGPVSLEDMQQRLSQYLGRDHELPIVRQALRRARLECDDWSGRFIGGRFNQPCMVSLFNNYWLEQGNLVQTMNALCRRFQNVAAWQGRDVLRNLNFDTLRPLSSLIWGWCQSECDRLSVLQRKYEYANQFGSLCATDNAGMQPAQTGSSFKEAFHRLLRQSAVFFKEDYETTVIADAYNVLISLKQTNRILAASLWGNQAVELTLAARAETMLTQFILAQPETLRAFNVPLMAAYDEAWEPAVDAMTALQGWGTKPVSYYRDLAVYGEKILLGIMLPAWQLVENVDSAAHWLRFNRNHIKQFMSSYYAVTGIDLTVPETADSPVARFQSQRQIPAQPKPRWARAAQDLIG